MEVMCAKLANELGHHLVGILRPRFVGKSGCTDLMKKLTVDPNYPLVSSTTAMDSPLKMEVSIARKITKIVHFPCVRAWSL